MEVWVTEVVSAADPVKKLTGGAVSMTELRMKIKQEVEDIVQMLIEPLEPLKTLLKPFFDIYSKVFDAIKAVKEAYQVLRNSYQEARSLINQIFGPKVHRHFPRTYRLAGGGCNTDGFYPTDTNGYYDDQGVDLLVDEGSHIVSPFAGRIRRSYGNSNQIELRATGGSFRNTIITITNIEPNATIIEGQYLRVSKGQRIGHATISQPCSGEFNHIHFAIKQVSPNRLSEVSGGSESGGNEETQGFMDPTKLLESRPIEAPEWIQECDDYKLVFRGEVIKAGSVLGGNKGNKKNTSPKRKSKPKTTPKTPLNSAYRPKPPKQNSLTTAAMNGE
ncbi:uncharacterized protein [Amphiura filiformis]|uniref:uncharacterized protein n=1 Tax=Amphiura filiformis TaxID=82378 RepID=UPI003B2284B6